jgi:3-oxoacyl-[acyl-carrier protein] reductase/meso-butanediol dehydrogenase/(S,S)-butanediol dehydrogenase/diacetyl reductase
MKPAKTVVVTGGDKGVGASISRAFYNEGYSVVIGSRHDKGLAKEFKGRGKFQATDVRDLRQLTALIETAVDWTGRLDLMVNNAGFSEWRSLEDADEVFWNKMIDTNLKGTFFGCKIAAAYLKPGSGIINISSLAGKRGSANNSVYCASKFGVNGITQSLAKELGPRGIRVNAVCPVYIKTEGLVEALKDNNSPAQGKDVRKYLNDFAQSQSGLKRLPEADEIARVCLFLASDESSAVTGQCINVDCGVLPQ